MAITTHISYIYIKCASACISHKTYAIKLNLTGTANWMLIIGCNFAKFVIKFPRLSCSSFVCCSISWTATDWYTAKWLSFVMILQIYIDFVSPIFNVYTAHHIIFTLDRCLIYVRYQGHHHKWVNLSSTLKFAILSVLYMDGIFCTVKLPCLFYNWSVQTHSPPKNTTMTEWQTSKLFTSRKNIIYKYMYEYDHRNFKQTCTVDWGSDVTLTAATLFPSLAVILSSIASNLPILVVIDRSARRDTHSPPSTSRNRRAYKNTLRHLVATKYRAVLDDPNFSPFSGMLWNWSQNSSLQAKNHNLAIAFISAMVEQWQSFT